MYHFMADEVEEIYILRYIAFVLFRVSLGRELLWTNQLLILVEVYHISAETKI